MKRRIVAVIASMFTIMAMVPAMAFGQRYSVDVDIFVGYPGSCIVTQTDGTEVTVDYESSFTKEGCTPGTTIQDAMGITEISTPEINGDSSGFLGWAIYMGGDDENLYPVKIGEAANSEALLQYVIPVENEIEPGKPYSISIEAEWAEGAWTEPEPVRFAVSGNGGELVIKDEMDGTNKTVDCFDGEFMAPGPVGNAVPFKILSAEKSGSVLSGWTVYEADAITFDEVRAADGLNIGDPNSKILLHDTYTDSNGVAMNVYISLWYSRLIDSSMSTEDLYNLGGNDKSYYAVANWTTGTVQEMTVNGQPARLEIAGDIVAVDSNLRAKFKNVEQIKNALLREAYAANETFIENSMKIQYMDIILKIKNKDGIWEVATPENFPEEGIKVVIPYPAGINKDISQFSVLHMFTHGNKAGTIEVLKPALKEDGLHVVVHSLSPFAVAYQEMDYSPAAGDTTPVLPLLAMMTAALAGTGWIMRRHKL